MYYHRVHTGFQSLSNIKVPTQNKILFDLNAWTLECDGFVPFSSFHLNAWTLEGDGFVPFSSFNLNAWTLEGDGFVPFFSFHLNAWTLEGDGFDPFFPLPARLFLQLSAKAVHLNVCRQNKCLILLFRKKMNALDERKVKCTVGRSFVFGTARKPRMLCFISDVETHGIYLSPTANSRNKIIHFLWPRFSYTWFLKKKR